MAQDFPASPVNGQVFANFTYDGIVGVWRNTPDTASGLPAGSIMAWSGATAPANWLICDGSAISRSDYASLFNTIGTQYGVGNGSTTFNIPDLRGRVPVGKNSATFSTLGSTGGAEAITLDITQIPSHTHTQNSHTHTGTTTTNGNHSHGGILNTYSNTTSGNSGINRDLSGNQNQISGWAGDHNHTFTTDSTTATNQNTGGGGSHSNLQPYQVINYIIKTSAGVTAGDSELATRVGAIETTTVRPIALGGTGSSVGINLVPTGAILMWYTATPPEGWLICNGQSTSGYTALAALVGATVPNMQQRVPVGKNATGTFATLGATGGSETVTLTEANIPSHTHTGTTASAGNHTHTYAGTTGNSGNHQHALYVSGTQLQYVNTSASLSTGMGGLAGVYNNDNLRTGTNGDHNHSYSGTTSDVSTNHTHTFTTNATGSGTAITNLQPYIVVNYIIKT